MMQKIHKFRTYGGKLIAQGRKRGALKRSRASQKQKKLGSWQGRRFSLSSPSQGQVKSSFAVKETSGVFKNLEEYGATFIVSERKS